MRAYGIREISDSGRCRPDGMVGVEVIEWLALCYFGVRFVCPLDADSVADRRGPPGSGELTPDRAADVCAVCAPAAVSVSPRLAEMCPGSRRLEIFVVNTRVATSHEPLHPFPMVFAASSNAARGSSARGSFASLASSSRRSAISKSSSCGSAILTI